MTRNKTTCSKITDDCAYCPARKTCPAWVAKSALDALIGGLGLLIIPAALFIGGFGIYWGW
jgi:hypothetical protein